MHSVLCPEGTKSSALRRIASSRESTDSGSGVPIPVPDRRSDRVNEEGWLDSLIHHTLDQDPDDPQAFAGSEVDANSTSETNPRGAIRISVASRHFAGGLQRQHAGAKKQSIHEQTRNSSSFDGDGQTKANQRRRPSQSPLSGDGSNIGP